MKTKIRLAIMTLAVVGPLAGGLAAYGRVNTGVRAQSAGPSAQAVSPTAPVVNFHDHNEIVVINPGTGTSELVRTLEGLERISDFYGLVPSTIPSILEEGYHV